MMADCADVRKPERKCGQMRREITVVEKDLSG